MKNLITLFASICIGSALFLSGCGTSGALPFVPAATNVQASTYSVQGAEKLLATAHDTLDLFLGLDDLNRAAVKQQLPQVHAFAEKMRSNNYAANLLERGNNAKNAFKHNRTADNQASLNTIMVTIASLQADLETNTAKLKKGQP